VNRRKNREAELTHLTHLNGPNDYSVPVLKVEDMKGNIKAVVFGYACHPTVLDGYEWCGDYPGFAQIELEKLYPGATALFFQGAGADQNPLPRRSIPLARQYGKELAAAVERVIDEPMRELQPRLETAYSEISLEMETPPGGNRIKEIKRGVHD
jgi:neutral ceramidase